MKKVCKYCENVFMAHTQKTLYCSGNCFRKDKKREKGDKKEWFKKRSKRESSSDSEAKRKSWRTYYQTHREECLAYRAKYLEDNKEYPKLYKVAHDYVWKVKNYFLIDKKKGLENNVTPEWFLENIKGKVCIYCGTIEDIGCDRLDNTKGHTIDNCVPCCSVCNYVRGDVFTFEEMKERIGPIIASIRLKRPLEYRMNKK